MAVQDIFKKTMAEFVKKREIKQKELVCTRAPEVSATENSIQTYVNQMSEKLKSNASSNTQPTRYISRSIKTNIRIRSKDQCEYISPHTHRRCEARTGLQFDHHIPFSVQAENGPETEKNIRRLCAAHNRLAAIQYFGEAKIQKYLKI